MKLLSLLAIAIATVSFNACAQWAKDAGTGVTHATGQRIEINAPSNERLAWMLWPRLTSGAETPSNTENVVQYSQHYHFGKGSAFGHVIEVQKLQPEGNVWGIEVDLLTRPRHAASYFRVGVGVVLAPPTRHNDGSETSHASHAFLALPFGDAKARVDYGLEIRVPCDVACVAIPAGERVQLSPDPVVGALSFDPVTGILGMWRRNRFLVWGIQQATGQEFRMQQF